MYNEHNDPLLLTGARDAHFYKHGYNLLNMSGLFKGIVFGKPALFACFWHEL